MVPHDQLAQRSRAMTTITKSHDLNQSINLQPTPPIPDGSWIIDIKQKLIEEERNFLARSWLKRSIYRIPSCFKENDDKLYIPQSVSIGPYHHFRPELKPMNRHKWRALYYMLNRTKHDINLYLNAVSRLEGRIRSCYEDDIPIASNKFVEMMTLDGNFILEYLIECKSGFLDYSKKDHILGLESIIERDLMMLENQIPLFVLNTLYGIQLNNRAEKVAPLTTKFFDMMMPNGAKRRGRYPDDGLHLLDIFCKSLQTFDNEFNEGRDIQEQENETSEDGDIQEQENEINEDGNIQEQENEINEDKKIELVKACLKWKEQRRFARVKDLISQAKDLFPCLKEQKQNIYGESLIPCVEELKQAGVKFQAIESMRFWDISFEGNILKMPKLLINYNTHTLLLNLVAFEQCHQLKTKYRITSYVEFMDRLINSPEDVAHLYHNGIIAYTLGSGAEVANIFNNIGRSLVMVSGESKMSEISKQINKFYRSKWHTWGAILKHNYFGNPWSTIAIIAAFIVLILTSTQTFYTVYQYYKPPI